MFLSYRHPILMGKNKPTREIILVSLGGRKEGRGRSCISLPSASPTHDLLELGPRDAPPDAGAAVGLEDHVAQQGLVDVLLERHGDALEVGERERFHVSPSSGSATGAGEQAERLLDFGGVRPALPVVARVQLQRADGEERLVRGVALVVWV